MYSIDLTSQVQMTRTIVGSESSVRTSTVVRSEATDARWY